MIDEFRKKLVNLAFDTLDTDHDGKIGKDDFMKYLNHPSFPPQAADEIAKFIFQKKPTIGRGESPVPMCIMGSFMYADKDGDKRISREEMYAYYTELAKNLDLAVPSKESMDAEFAEKDKEKKGFLNVDGFVEFFDAKEKLIDTMKFDG